MNWDFMFFVNSMLLGVGLAMDAFSISLANGLNENSMKKGRMCFIAGVYAFYQFLMPMIGWICVHEIAEKFTAFQKFIPWIALILLLFIGGKMIVEAILEISKNKKVAAGKDNANDAASNDENSAVLPESQKSAKKKLTFSLLMLQGIATSIDALSVGFTIATYNLAMAVTASLIIAAVTFVICFAGLAIGKKAGTKLADRAGILGGCILVFIGIEIFVKGVFF